MTDDEWLDEQQRQHNLNTYRWSEPKRRSRRYRFTDVQMLIAIRSLQKKEQPNG